MPLPPDVLDDRARKLRMLLFDVDGVFSDGSVVVGSDGTESKAFFVRDGAAVIWARRAGLTVGLLSGRTSGATTRRAAELGIGLVEQGHLDKRSAYERICEDAGLTDEQVAYMGDDMLDLPVIARVGLSAAPADAVPDVLSRVDWVSHRPGGRGAVRDFVELVLRARGRWDSLVDEHLAM